MELAVLDDVAELVEKANANLQPELLTADVARDLLKRYSKIKKLASYGEAVLARKIDDASEVALVTGTSIGKAKVTVSTGVALEEAPPLSEALSGGEVSLEQAAEIAKAEQARPGSSVELLSVAKTDAFHVLKDRARKICLEAEQHIDLGARQHDARSARNYGDDLGMVHIDLVLEPHVGTPIVNRAEAEAARLWRRTRAQDPREPFEQVLADAYAALLAGAGKGRATRPELVVLVSHEVVARGWKDVRQGEVCKIPGVGPLTPAAAKRIAEDAFLSGVFFDGVDLRHFRRWTRHTPVEVRVALELEPPPRFDGIRCVDCGNRLGTEFDHEEPHAAGGPASNGNLRPRCWPCHRAKTARDRRAGKLTPAAPGTGRAPP